MPSSLVTGPISEESPATRDSSTTARELAQETVGVARVAKETGLTRQTVYRIKGDPASAEAALAAWGL